MQEMEGQCWRQICKLTVAGKVEGLCWSHTGSILAVSFGSGDAVLYKESLRGSYEEIGKVGEEGAAFQEIVPSACPPASAMDDPSAMTVAAASLPPAAAATSTVSSEMAAQQAAVLDSFGDMM
jgi:hypothetical protein